MVRNDEPAIFLDDITQLTYPTPLFVSRLHASPVKVRAVGQEFVLFANVLDNHSIRLRE